jgi:hypothetical protein
MMVYSCTTENLLLYVKCLAIDYPANHEKNPLKASSALAVVRAAAAPPTSTSHPTTYLFISLS